MPEDPGASTAALVEAIRALRVDRRPRSDGLRVAWPTDGATWTTTWAEAIDRDLAIASSALTRAKDTGATDEGAADVETALWRVDSAFEKFHDVVALTLGVPAMTLNRDKRGVRRFESDPRRNRRTLRELAEAHAAAQELLDIEERIYNHRFLALRHQMTHSLAPILEWKSLMWFEVGEVDHRGSIAGYSAFHLTPSDDLQMSVQPQSCFHAPSETASPFLTSCIRSSRSWPTCSNARGHSLRRQ